MSTVSNRGMDTAAELFDLIERLGGIPPARVLLRPTPGEATEDDLLDYLHRTGKRSELIDGVLVEKAMGQGRSGIAGWLLQCLAAYVARDDIGYFITEAGFLRLREGVVRAPDISFSRWDRAPCGQIDMAPIRESIPDLAVEIISEGNTDAEIQRKTGEYFQAGVEAVWVVDPFRRVVVDTSPEDSVMLKETETLEGSPVFPGLDLPLARLFGRVPVVEKRPRRKRGGS